MMTFVFTDVAGSTLLLRRLGEDAYASVLERHFQLLREAVSAHNGVEVRTYGDSSFAAFAKAADAVAAVLQAQLAFADEGWPAEGAPRVRVGLHAGHGQLSGGNYVGLAVHQAARVAGAAHGGQVVATQAIVDAARRLEGGASWRSLGVHRLKDLGSPVELSQLCHPRLEDGFPPLNSLEQVAHNLPVQLSSFVGRAEELALGTKLLSRTRLLSVTGAGGTGKTRLAYQLAAEVASQFPGGVWVAELAALADPALVPPMVMRALGLREGPGLTPTATIVNYLESRQALLVLDNCEHLVDAVAALTGEVLKACARVKVLTTGREPLHARGETVWALAPLCLPPPGEQHLGAVATSDAVALFCERAAEARVEFCLSERNAATVSQVCSALGGIPLAIELVAAQLRARPLKELARSVAGNIDFPTGAPRGTSPRQSSLRASLQWSHDLLAPAEQVLFRRLAVFAGGFSTASAEAVCAGGLLSAAQVAPTLDGLTDKSLVVLDAGPAGDGRSRMLEPLRLYAGERLEEAGEAGEVAAKHASYFAGVAHRLTDPNPPPEDLDQLEVEHPNLLAALGFVAARDDAATHGQMATDLWRFWELRGYWGIGRAEVSRYMERGDDDPTRRLRGARVLGNLALQLADMAEARRWHNEALRLGRELGDRQAEAGCLYNCALGAFLEGNHERTRALLDEALLAARQVGHRQLECRVIGVMAEVAEIEGDMDAAWSTYSEAVLLAEQLDRFYLALLHAQRGQLAVRVGDHSQARDDLAKAMRAADELGVPMIRMEVHAGLGDLDLSTGNYAAARAHYELAHTFAEETGYGLVDCYLVGQLGVVALRLGDWPEAERHLNAALAAAKEMHHSRYETLWLGHLGTLALERGELARAGEHYDQATALAAQLNYRRALCELTCRRGELAIRTGDHSRARAYLDEALGVARHIKDRGQERACLTYLADLAMLAEDYEEAEAHVRRGLEICQLYNENDTLLLDVTAALLASTGRHGPAAGLLGAADGLNAAQGRRRSAWDKARYERTVAVCTDALGHTQFCSITEGPHPSDWEKAVTLALARPQWAV